MTDFVNLITEMRSGAVAIDLNNKFNEMLTAVLETGGKGEFAVIVKAAPSKMGMGLIVEGPAPGVTNAPPHP